MTDCCVYVGDLKDSKFNWEGGDWNGNVPGAITPSFPPPPNHYNADFHAWVKRTGVECKQTDFGGWVAKATKNQVLDYLRTTYSSSQDLPWVKLSLPEVFESSEALDDHTFYALVATEF